MPGLKSKKLCRVRFGLSLKRLKKVFLSVVLFSSVTPALAQEGDVVRIVSISNSNAKTGAGFCFDDQHQSIATCYHCIIGAQEIQVVLRKDIYSTDSSGSRRVEIVGVDSDNDLAVLKLYGSKLKAFHVVIDGKSIQEILRAKPDVTIKGCPNG